MILERTTVHISDDSGRIAMLEKHTIGTDDSAPTLTRYVYSNHLQSASLELDEEADIISYEEYHPYGTTAFQAKNATINAVAKRYRYTGKERDEESGLYYHGARYYIPWLARWTAIDPMESKYAGISPYNYCANNPVIYLDDDGKDHITFTQKTIETTIIFGSKYGRDMSTQVKTTIFDFKIDKASGPDRFFFEKSTQQVKEYNEYDEKSKGWKKSSYVNSENSYYKKELKPFDTKSQTGATTRLGYAFQDLVTWDVKDYDSATVGKMMTMSKSLSNYINSRHKEAKNWERQANVSQNLDAIAPIYARTMFSMAVAELIAIASSNSAFKVDLMGGKTSQLGKGWINYDLAATSGIADDVGNFSRYFPENSVSQIVANNPRAVFLQEVNTSLQSGGTVTVRGTMNNKFFNQIYNGKAEGLGNYEVIRKVENVANKGYMHSNGLKPVEGTINEIVLKKIN